MEMGVPRDHAGRALVSPAAGWTAGVVDPGTLGGAGAEVVGLALLKPI